MLTFNRDARANASVSEGMVMSKSIRNGTSASCLTGVAWRKSSYSGKYGNCVEAGSLATGEIAVRNSRYPSGPALIFSRAEVAAFLAMAKDGEFDDRTS
jgi:Domain of unknown function (DUF397)